MRRHAYEGANANDVNGVIAVPVIPRNQETSVGAN